MPTCRHTIEMLEHTDRNFETGLQHELQINISF